MVIFPLSRGSAIINRTITNERSVHLLNDTIATSQKKAASGRKKEVEQKWKIVQ
jgi:hypothetical protein